MNRLSRVVILTALISALLLVTQSCAHREIKVGEPIPAIEPGEVQSLPLTGSFRVHRSMLKNGLKILVIEDHSSPTFAYQTWFKVGSREEVPGRTGLAHLFEHLMFKETSRYKDGEFDRMMEEAGSQGTNAFTSQDYTAYVEELPKDRLELVMQLESDRMVNLAVDENHFKTERDVVQNERRMRNENSPTGLMWQELHALAYTEHPYHWPVIGYESDLASMTAEDARKFYKLWYSPNKAVIVVVGDVQASEVFKMARKYYGELPVQPDNTQEITPEPEQTSPRRKTLRLNLQVERLLASYPVPKASHEDIPALFILSTLLTNGKSSRLYRALVETGLATSVESSVQEHRDAGYLYFEIGMQKGKHSAQAEAVLTRELEAAIKNGINQAELDRAKNSLLFGFYDGFNESSNIANFVGSYEILLGGFELALRNYEKAQTITPEQVQAVAVKYLDPKKRTTINGVMK